MVATMNYEPVVIVQFSIREAETLLVTVGDTVTTVKEDNDALNDIFDKLEVALLHFSEVL